MEYTESDLIECSAGTMKIKKAERESLFSHSAFYFFIFFRMHGIRMAAKAAVPAEHGVGSAFLSTGILLF